MSARPSAIFIGASAGGVHALQKLLLHLAPGFRLPLVAVLHLPANSHLQPESIFPHRENLLFAEPTTGTPIQPNHFYLAPADYHLLVEKDGTFSLSQDEPVHFSRPSIDVLFESAAHAFGDKACGILLTGANHDGALGLRAIHEAGGFTLVQDPKDSANAMMPQSAIDLFDPDHVATIEEIARIISCL